jgi:hypothetical protein
MFSHQFNSVVRRNKEYVSRGPYITIKELKERVNEC